MIRRRIRLVVCSVRVTNLSFSPLYCIGFRSWKTQSRSRTSGQTAKSENRGHPGYILLVDVSAVFSSDIFLSVFMFRALFRCALGGGALRRVSAFWQTLTRKPLQDADGLVTLDVPLLGVVKFLPQFYVRASYVGLWNAINQPRPLDQFLVRGNPGIGKTFFLAYVMWQLAQRGNAAVLYHSVHHHNRAYLLSPDGTVAALHVDDIDNLEPPEGSELWYLVDSVMPVLDLPATKVVMVSSPGRQAAYKDYAQEFTVKLFMPVWTKDELAVLAMRCYPDRGGWQRLLELWGGIPRWVFHAYESASKRELERAINSCDPKQHCVFMGEGDVPNHLSFKLLHYVVVENGSYEEYSIGFASPFVADEVLAKYETDILEEVAAFMKGAEGEGWAGGARGHLWEAYCHRKLRLGGQFRIRPLQSAKTAASTVTVPSSPQTVLWKVGDLANLSSPRYGRPFSKTVCAIDSVLWNRLTGDTLLQHPWLCQITVSNDHGVKVDGVKAAAAHLKQAQYKIVFVVPPSGFDEMTTQAWLRKGDTVARLTKAEEKWAEQFSQFALEIPLDLRAQAALKKQRAQKKGGK